MKSVLITMALFATISCLSQNIPSQVKNSFTKNFPGIAVKKWDKEDGNYEANFTKEGKSMSATYDAAGNLQETETDIKVSELPSAAMDYIRANYKGASIKEAAIRTTATGEKMYEAEVKGKDVLFDNQGKFVKEEKD